MVAGVMSGEPKNKTDPEATPLEYVTPGTETEGARPYETVGIIAGILSAAAMVIQLPWGYLAFMSAWDRAKELPSSQAMAVQWIMIMLPTVIALPLGVASITLGGLSERNALGLMGLIFAALAAGAVLWHFFL